MLPGIPSAFCKITYAMRKKYNKLSIWTAYLHNYSYRKLYVWEIVDNTGFPNRQNYLIYNILYIGLITPFSAPNPRYFLHKLHFVNYLYFSQRFLKILVKKQVFPF
ncbi:hypothetical protein FORC087_053 (plasmid) [Bacillus cereus]|nr:hypothetical protein FORC087_053 [Bacillus cereus]